MKTLLILVILMAGCGGHYLDLSLTLPTRASINTSAEVGIIADFADGRKILNIGNDLVNLNIIVPQNDSSFGIAVNRASMSVDYLDQHCVNFDGAAIWKERGNDWTLEIVAECLDFDMPVRGEIKGNY